VKLLEQCWPEIEQQGMRGHEEEEKKVSF